ncbi:hypothetical protein WMY93_030584 [Mugilogobius chulae]|uniref:Uncharacterized protein n=1 Tax=Mugilogobius chulae TaxID=88201 RepID=A0AAW0MEE9_9GOBI
MRELHEQSTSATCANYTSNQQALYARTTRANYNRNIRALDLYAAARILHCLLVGAHSSRTALERLSTRLLTTRAHRGEIEQRGEEQEERKREKQEERKREEQEERKREEQEERKREEQEEETGSATESYLLTRCCL